MAIGVKTGGRQKGTPNKKTAKLLEAVAAEGITPLEYMLGVMRDAKAEFPRRDEMAKAAAPYLHARLQSTTVTGADGGPVKISFDKDDEGLL